MRAYRFFKKNDNKMIYPETEESGIINHDWPIMHALGIHGKPITIDKDSFKENQIIGWNIDHNTIAMRCTGLTDKRGGLIWEGDICAIDGKLYKVVDDVWIFRFERNLVEFGENDDIYLNEDTAFESTIVGDFYQNKNLLKKENNETD